MSYYGTDTWTSSPNGWVCRNCGTWVLNGTTHACVFGWSAAPAYTPPPCDHCLCLDSPDKGRPYTPHGTRTLKHSRCCHCGKDYA